MGNVWGTGNVWGMCGGCVGDVWGMGKGWQGNPPHHSLSLSQGNIRGGGRWFSCLLGTGCHTSGLRAVLAGPSPIQSGDCGAPGPAGLCSAVGSGPHRLTSGGAGSNVGPTTSSHLDAGCNKESQRCRVVRCGIRLTRGTMQPPSSNPQVRQDPHSFPGQHHFRDLQPCIPQCTPLGCCDSVADRQRQRNEHASDALDWQDLGSSWVGFGAEHWAAGLWGCGAVGLKVSSSTKVASQPVGALWGRGVDLGQGRRGD